MRTQYVLAAVVGVVGVFLVLFVPLFFPSTVIHLQGVATRTASSGTYSLSVAGNLELLPPTLAVSGTILPSQGLYLQQNALTNGGGGSICGTNTMHDSSGNCWFTLGAGSRCTDQGCSGVFTFKTGSAGAFNYTTSIGWGSGYVFPLTVNYRIWYPGNSTVNAPSGASSPTPVVFN